VHCLAHQFEARAHDVVRFLGVESLGHAGEAGYVAEEDGDELTALFGGACRGRARLCPEGRQLVACVSGVGRGCVQIASALLAEPRARRVGRAQRGQTGRSCAPQHCRISLRGRRGSASGALHLVTLVALAARCGKVAMPVRVARGRDNCLARFLGHSPGAWRHGWS
jgi:hypothetical protein